jgi:hypothetical protein
MTRTFPALGLSFTLFLAGTPATAQDVEAEVMAVVETLFEGMRQADTTMIRSTLHPDARLATARSDAQGEPTISFSPMDTFLRSVAGSQAVLDERLFHPEVRVEGGLATVWTYYELWVGDQFSHCGYDAFQLARAADGWKIVAIADNRRSDGCEPPSPGS